MENDQGNQNQNGDQGQQNSLGWRAALPDEFKEHDLVKTHQKPGDFVKWAIETKTNADAIKTKLDSSIPKLSENATDDEKNAFYKSLGRPEKPDGYEFVGENLEPKSVDWFRTTAYKYGLTKDQAQGLQGDFNQFATALVAADAEARKAEDDKRKKDADESEVALKKEWGEEKYQANKEIADRRIPEILTPEFAKLLETVQVDGRLLGNHPAFIKGIYTLLSKTGEDKSPPSTPSKGSGASGTFSATKFYESIAVKKQ